MTANSDGERGGDMMGGVRIGGRRQGGGATAALSGALPGVLAVVLSVAVAACSRQNRQPSTASGATPAAPVPGRLAVTAGASDTSRMARATVADTDVATAGTGLPKGYLAQFDLPMAKPADVAYAPSGDGRWEVHTGPAHILYALHDTAHGSYTVTATLEQLQKPVHPESFGIFIGGSSLDAPAKRQYTYFLVRGDGKYLVKVRDGTRTRTVTDWTAHPAVPTEDAAGTGVYGIKVEVAGKTAKVSVNGKPVTTITSAAGPLDGVAGVRINHNLHVMVTPVSIVRSH